MNESYDTVSRGRHKESPPPIVCPKCNKAVEHLGCLNDAPCAVSDCPYEIQDGIPCVNRIRAQFGEAGTDEMRNLLQIAREKGWQEAITSQFTGDRSFVHDLITNEKRIKFSELVNVNRDEDVLDIGCGYGGVAAQLSKKARSVTALDITLERIALLEIRKQQEGLNNIQTVCNGDILNLPFEDNSFDVIYLIGVMEYFPLSLPNHEVWDAQVRSLREIQRILRPGGRIYLGVKNRFGWPYLVGAQDHNNLAFGPILPHKVADYLSRWINKKPYRIISQGYGGYKRLLTACNFTDIQMHWPVHGYQMPSTFVALDGVDATNQLESAHIKNPLKRSIVWLLFKCNMLRFVVPQFSIVAGKPDQVSN